MGVPRCTPTPLAAPSPRWPLQSSLCGAWAGWQRTAEERAAIQPCWREENNFFALFFLLQCPSPACECGDLKGLCPRAITPG